MYRAGALNISINKKILNISWVERLIWTETTLWNIKGPVSIWTIQMHWLSPSTAYAMVFLAVAKPEHWRNTCNTVMIVSAFIHHGRRKRCLIRIFLSPRLSLLISPWNSPATSFSPNTALSHWREYGRMTSRGMSNSEKKKRKKNRHSRVWDVAMWKKS